MTIQLSTIFAALILTASTLFIFTLVKPTWGIDLVIKLLDSLMDLGKWASHAREGVLTGYNVYRLRRTGQFGINVVVMKESEQDKREMATLVTSQVAGVAGPNLH